MRNNRSASFGIPSASGASRALLNRPGTSSSPLCITNSKLRCVLIYASFEVLTDTSNSCKSQCCVVPSDEDTAQRVVLYIYRVWEWTRGRLRTGGSISCAEIIAAWMSTDHLEVNHCLISCTALRMMLPSFGSATSTALYYCAVCVTVVLSGLLPRCLT